MATNRFFQNYDNIYEQNLIDDLVIESIKMYGVDIIYITRSIQARDNMFNEDSASIFDETWDFEVYVKNIDGFEGEGDFLSRFGLEIRDQATFTVANRTFERYVTRNVTNRTRPYEGDLIYFPLNEKMFKVTHVEHESVFYQTGALQMYDMKCELFSYSGERFETGRDNIDTLFEDEDLTTATTLSAVSNTTVGATNIYFETEGDDIIDFSEVDPFSEAIDFGDR